MTHQQQTAFENIVGKEEIAHNEQFLIFPQCFLLNHKIMFPFVNIFDIESLFAAELGGPKLGISGKGLLNETQVTVISKLLLAMHNNISLKKRVYIVKCVNSKIPNA